MMSKALLFQQVWEGSEYIKLLEECFPVHLEYCQKHNFDYIVHSRTIIKAKWGGWDKYQYFLDYLQDYDFVAYIDADAIIHQTGVDLRDCLPEQDKIGATWHLWPRGHWNVGILYATRGERVNAFMREILTRQPGPYRWADQQVFIDMASSPEWKGVVKTLPTTWNAIYQNCDTDNPIVRAYHGCGNVQNRLQLMREKAIMTLEEHEKQCQSA